MSRTARLGVCLFTLSFLAVGCGPNEKDLKIEDLQAENDQLKRELEDKDRQMAEASARENEARATVDELNRELARARADVASARNNTRPAAPPTQPAVVQGGDGWISTPSFDMISIPGEVLFASGRAELTSQGRGTISKLASDIQARYSDRDIFVFGHTDDDPIRKSKWKDNWELGAARALTCVRELQQRGVPGGTLIQANCSQFRPSEANASRASKSKNRRVEFYAVPRGGVLTRTTSRR